MRLKLIIIFIFLGWSSTLLAQIELCSYSISGKVLDIETKEPIPYVSIQVRGTERATTTDVEGNFLIEGLCSDENTLIVSCFGYCDSVCEHHHQHEKSPHIYLTQEVVGLDTVTIAAEKSKEDGTETISQTRLEKSAIRIDPTQSLAASLSEEQGVSFTSVGTNIQIPVIHGLYGNRVLILNNGLKHGFQNWGTDHAPEIDISSAHAVTIIKGASGVRFGPEALGGAVVVESNPLYLNEPFYADIGTGYQTNGRGVFTNVEAGSGYKNWSYFVNGNYTKIGDRHAPDYSLTNTGKEEKNLGFGTRYHLDKWDFKIYYSYVNQNLALLRASVADSGNAFIQAINSEEPIFIRPFSYDINEPNQLTQHHLGKAEINWLYSDQGKLTFRAGRQFNHREEFDVRRNADTPIIDLDLVTSDYQLEWKHPDWYQLDGLIGVQFFNQDNNNNPGTGTTPFIPNYNTNRYSVFMVESKSFGKNTLEAGLRFDYESNDVRGRETSQAIFSDTYSFTNLTSSIGYVRKIGDHSSFRTNLGTAWRTPNMAELYSFGQHGFKTSYGLLRYYTDSDGTLRTNRVIPMDESGVKAEKGYKFINEFHIHEENNSHTVTLYGHYIENYIFDRPYAVIGTIRGPMPAFIYDQTDAAFLGADYSWKRDWSKQFSGTFGLSYLWSDNITDNEPLINQPPISTSYKLEWKRSNLGALEASNLSIKPSYTFEQFQAPRTVSPEALIDGSEMITSDSEIFDFKDAPEGYFLLDVAWSFKWKSLRAGVTVKNVLNTSYRDYLNEMRYFADELGRNVLFTLNYTIKTKRNK